MRNGHGNTGCSGSRNRAATEATQARAGGCRSPKQIASSCSSGTHCKRYNSVHGRSTGGRELEARRSEITEKGFSKYSGETQLQDATATTDCAFMLGSAGSNSALWQCSGSATTATVGSDLITISPHTGSGATATIAAANDTGSEYAATGSATAADKLFAAIAKAMKLPESTCPETTEKAVSEALTTTTLKAEVKEFPTKLGKVTDTMADQSASSLIGQA
ncbi:hypothetical protein DPX39_040089900 [Trypanosoma brucei equiperdum]|uniref:Trypanosome variant surface glycoprotein A-type N-terminal domain-containing protein n=1 Tax=Trypanosoma brucei equiperdum TaxID=630700 RepID=A0A3L6L8Y6_9TRYP|nr:hypothetical protein DPX39_040089900 [Trypanosoma brucei equiperdum]